jgi:hypothetical protein
MRATAQDVGAPQATATVFFSHSGSPGESSTDSTLPYSAVKTFTDPDTQDLQFGSGTATVSATPLVIGGTAELPDLHALAAPEAQGNNEGVSATASFSDTLEFSNPDALTPTVFNFSFLVTGSLSGNSSAVLNASWGFGANNGMVFTTTSVAQLFTLSVPSSSLSLFVNNSNDSIGGPFGISLSAIADNTEPNSTTLESSTADFSQTVELVSADALDANGNPVAGTFTDGDQILFPANTVFVTATPEPGTLALLVPALLLLLAFVRKQSRMARLNG